MAQNEWSVSNNFAVIESDTTTTPPVGEASPVVKIWHTSALTDMQGFYPTNGTVEGKTTKGFTEGSMEVWGIRSTSTLSTVNWQLTFRANPTVSWSNSNAYHVYAASTSAIRVVRGTNSSPNTLVTSGTITGFTDPNVWRGLRAYWWKSSPSNSLYIRVLYNLADGNGWQFAFNDFADTNPNSDDVNTEAGLGYLVNGTTNATYVKFDGFRLFTKT